MAHELRVRESRKDHPGDLGEPEEARCEGCDTAEYAHALRDGLCPDCWFNNWDEEAEKVRAEAWDLIKDSNSSGDIDLQKLDELLKRSRSCHKQLEKRLRGE